MSEEIPATIAERLFAIMKELPYLQKDGKMEKLNIKFLGDAKIRRTVRKYFIKYQIMPLSTQVRDLKVDSSMTTFVREFTFVAIDTGETLTIETVGQGKDSGDKGAYKALTGSYKYLIRDTFCIETGDDPDDEDSETVNEKIDQESKRDRILAYLKKAVESQGFTWEVFVAASSKPIAEYDDNTLETLVRMTKQGKLNDRMKDAQESL